MKIMRFIEKNLCPIIGGTLIAGGACIGTNFYKLNQLDKYSEPTANLCGEVFSKNPTIFMKTEQEVKNMSAKEEFERWKEVNDSLDWAKAKSLSQRVQSFELRSKITKELEHATAQQAVTRWKQVTDSIAATKLLR